MNSEINTDFEDDQNYVLNDSNHAIEIVALASSQVSDALELSQRMTEPGKRWAIYLNGLALAGFRQWLTTRTTTFKLDETACMILAPSIADGTSAVCHLRAGDFRLCLIGTESISGDSIRVPQLVLDHPDFMAHFYLPITVYEEQPAIALQGFFRLDQIRLYQSSQTLSPCADHTYSLPKQWLESDLDSLLLYLNCLNPALIPLPQMSPPLMPQPIHQVLVQPVVNTARWFHAELFNQIESVAQHLKWVAMPQYAFASAMRELPDFVEWQSIHIEGLMNKLQQPDSQGLSIEPDVSSIWVALKRLLQPINQRFSTSPNLGFCQQPNLSPIEAIHQETSITPNVGAASCCFYLSHLELQIYAIVTLLKPSSSTAEWSMLLILKHPSDQPLPDGLSLEVRDLQTMQIVQRLQVSSAAGCLFTEVIGALTEQFLVTISLDNGLAITLPTLQFQPSAS